MVGKGYLGKNIKSRLEIINTEEELFAGNTFPADYVIRKKVTLQILLTSLKRGGTMGRFGV